MALKPYHRLEDTVTQTLVAFHQAEPLRRGMPREALRSRTGLLPPAFQSLLAALQADGVLVEAAAEVALAGHRPELSGVQKDAVTAIRGALDAEPFSPPLLDDLRRRFGLTPPLLQHLIDQGQLVRVSEEVVFSRDAVEQALTRFRTHLRGNPSLSVAAARDLLRSSRRYVLPLLEWLDAQKITRRVGDDRILRD